MGNSFKEIRRRIKGVKNTRQITKTMEMVAASKMRRAQTVALQMRPYAEKALEIMGGLAGKTGSITHPLLEKRRVNRTTVILITSDRGLCGGLNANLTSKVNERVKKMHKESVDFITLGKKGRDAMFRLGYKITADFSGLKKFDFNFIWPMISMAMSSFMKGETDRVILAYSKFINTLTQKPTFQPLLPLTQENLMDIAEDLVGKEHPAQKKYDYKFEPEAPSVLKSLLPKLTEMQIFKAVLESQASEQSARMVAMKNATDAADEITDELTLTYNQARQASITSEIAEISTAADALAKQ